MHTSSNSSPIPKIEDVGPYLHQEGMEPVLPIICCSYQCSIQKLDKASHIQEGRPLQQGRFHSLSTIKQPPEPGTRLKYFQVLNLPLHCRS